MLDLPFCFGEYGVQVADSFACGSLHTTENMVTCLYRIKMAGMSPLVTITWCKTLVGLGLSLNVQESAFCDGLTAGSKVDTKPWLFSKKKGSKMLEISRNFSVSVVWDLANAVYTSGPEPIKDFFFALVHDCEIVFLLGDMTEDVYEKTHAISASVNTIMISRREHIFGRRLYATKAQFGENGPMHDILIECNTKGKDPRLSVRVDKQLVLYVKRLIWKFRGNQTILVDGYPIELFWDVHNWFFSPSDGHAVFMFQTSTAIDMSWSSVATSSLFQWHHTSSSAPLLKGAESSGFSLLLYAWKSD
ncbi:hypothetical protein L7F22_041035 [Adiantum nelumboides]|nr:hypothetical protein [Adiantum nelumboides]